MKDGSIQAWASSWLAVLVLVIHGDLPPLPPHFHAGRMLMKDGSIQAVLPQSSEGFVAAPSFQGVRAGMCFKKGPAGIGYYMDEPLHKRLPQSAPPAYPPPRPAHSTPYSGRCIWP